jgi:hypothetical protein
MKQFTLKNKAGDVRTVVSTKEMAYLAARGYQVVTVDWV